MGETIIAGPNQGAKGAGAAEAGPGVVEAGLAVQENAEIALWRRRGYNSGRKDAYNY